VLNLVPLACPRGEVAHLQRQLQLVRKFLQSDSPESISTAVAAATIGGDHEFLCSWEPRRSHFGPPPADTCNRELRGVVIDTDADPTLIADQIVDSIRNRFAEFLVRKIVDIDFCRSSLWLPLGADRLEFPNTFLLFRVDGDHRLPLTLEFSNPSIDVAKLGVSIRMRCSLIRFAIGPQTIAGGFQQRRHGTIADVVTLLRRFLRQRLWALARPPQWRFWIATSQRVDHFLQRRPQSGILIKCFRPPPGRRTRGSTTSRGCDSRYRNSCNTVVTVFRDSPVAAATAVTPPQPICAASEAAHLRRIRSSIAASSQRNLLQIRSTTIAASLQFL
jgi:hypothetical protein